MNDNSTETTETAAAAQNQMAASSTLQADETVVKKDLENVGHSELKELLGNGLYIFKKTEHFTDDEIDALAKWIHNAVKARVGGR